MNFLNKETGALRRVLEQARNESGRSRNKLTVLSPQVDPYRLDTPAGHRDGAWLAEQLDRAVGWRGLHYAIVAAGIYASQTAKIIATTMTTGIGFPAAPPRPRDGSVISILSE
jgi:hypothetical protein